MKPKLADQIDVFICDHCASVHIGMYRRGKLIAEAIPLDPKAFAGDLGEAIAGSDALLSDAPRGRKH